MAQVSIMYPEDHVIELECYCIIRMTFKSFVHSNNIEGTNWIVFEMFYSESVSSGFSFIHKSF